MNTSSVTGAGAGGSHLASSSETTQPSTSSRLPPLHPVLLTNKIPKILPHERVFPVQIGTELFKLSGASISSDAPSYFTHYFLPQISQAQENGEDICSSIRTLYIDRDPLTFRDISQHLQGYRIEPRDGQHFVRLFVDAQFYTLPKLLSQLYEGSIFISIGHREFQIPRDMFDGPGNKPNYFSLGFGAFFTGPAEAFPGLDRSELIRPPSIIAPSVPHRSADIFQDLMQLMRGYPIHIRDEEHRAGLLRDCRYFNFKGLEQKLIPHHISFNQARQRPEMVLRVEDILKSGLSIVKEQSTIPSVPAATTSGVPTPKKPMPVAWVNYARPYEDDHPRELVLEIGGESMRIFPATMRAQFFDRTRSRMAKLLEVITSKINLPPSAGMQPGGRMIGGSDGSSSGSQQGTPGNRPPTSNPGPDAHNQYIRVMIDADAYIVLDGKSADYTTATGTESAADRDSELEPTASAAPATLSIQDPRGGLMNMLGSVPPASAEKIQQTGQSRPSSRKRKLGEGVANDYWVVKKGQWRIKVQVQIGPKTSGGCGPVAIECVLVAVNIDAYHGTEVARNAQRGFLS